MRTAARWGRVWGAAAPRFLNVGRAADPRMSVQSVIKPLHEEAGRSQRQQLPLARSWSWIASATAANGASAVDIAPFPSHVQQARCASSAVPYLDDPPQGDEALLHVLRCEVEDLTKKCLNITRRKPPKSFTLTKDEPGKMEMTLTRIYGLEDITIECVLQVVSKQYQRKPEVGENRSSRAKMLQLTISVTRGAATPTLRFRCECYRDGFVIHQVDLEGEDEEQSAYRPYFSDRKEELVTCFQLFLYERGLNEDLAVYIEKHLERKRLMKSAGVVESMKRFLSWVPSQDVAQD